MAAALAAVPAQERVAAPVAARGMELAAP